MAASTKRNVEIIDNRIKKLSVEELIDYLVDFDAVGFSGTIFEAREAVDVSRILRKEGILTIYGGPNATVNWDLYTGFFDIIFKGEGEKDFDRILDCAETGTFTKEFFEVNGTYINSKNFRIKDLDALPFPKRELVNINDYRRIEKDYLSGVEPVDTVVSSRGCPFDCSFCSSSVIWERRATFRSPANVVSEIKYLIENYGTKGIYFREDNFTTSRKRLLEFSDAIKPLEIKWICESRVDTLDKEILEKMKDAGCLGIWFGIESVSNDTLKKINKGITIEQAEKTVGLCREIGIKTGGSFIIGLPHENREDILKTIKGARSIGLDKVFFNRFFAIPKSKLYMEVKKKSLDRYEFENIIIPDTEYLHADEVTDLFWENAVSIKKRLLASLVTPRGAEIIDRILRNFL